jgi:hypothetical protein
MLSILAGRSHQVHRDDVMIAEVLAIMRAPRSLAARMRSCTG